MTQFDLTDDQLQIQEMARKFTADAITPFAAEWDEKHIFPRDTIRAAADPITRELYTSRAAEVAGVRKDVLEREVVTAGGGRREAGETPPPASPLPSPALPASAEKALLLLLLEGEPWRSRVRDAIDAEEFEFVPYREVFEAIADDAVLSLSETSARAYEQLRDEGLGDRDPNSLYERAVNWIENLNRHEQ